MRSSAGVMQHQLQVCHAAAALSARRAIAPNLLPQLRQRCSLRTGLQIVRAGEKKKLKQHLEALAEEYESRLTALELAHERNKLLRADEHLAPAQLLQSSGTAAAPLAIPALEFGELAEDALLLAKQAEAIDAATVSLAAGLRSLAGRLAALSGPVADTGVSTQPMAALPLLGSTDEDADALGPLTAEPSGQRSVVGGKHAIVNDPTEVDGGWGVTVTPAAPSNGPNAVRAPGTGYSTSVAELLGQQPVAEEPGLPLATAQVQAAINAVEELDVLNQEVDYIAEGERLLRQSRAAQPQAPPQATAAAAPQLQQPPPAAPQPTSAAAPPPAAPRAPVPTATAGRADVRKPPAAPAPRPKLDPTPFGKSGVSISKNLGRAPSGALSEEQLRALRSDVYAPLHEDGSSPLPGSWGPSRVGQNTQNGAGPPPTQQPAAEAEGSSVPQEPDLTKEQPGDAGYLAAVRAAMEQLSTGRGAGKSTPPAAGASAAAAAAAPASGDAAQAGGSGADAGGSTSVAGATEEIPSGPPKVLSMGDDDIFWVNQLQVALMKAGCYPADEEVEDFIFADGTHSALLTFQALNRLDETGIADMPTWAALLGPELVLVSGSPATSTSEAPAAVHDPVQPAEPQQPAAAPAWDSLFAAGANGAQQPSSNGAVGGPAADPAAAGQPSGRMAPPHNPAPSAGPPPSRWPVVRMDDGGREVHWLQCALELAGCYCGEDEMMWWQFGMATESALRTFQGMNGLPETGVSDAATWQTLLGGAAQPADLVNLSANNAQYDDDMSGHSDSVWLLGEQRWSRPVS